MRYSRSIQCVFLTCLIQWLTSLVCSAQQERVDYRPKIGEFKLESLMDYDTRMREGGAESEVEHEHLLRMKLGIPLVIKDNRMFGVQFKYYLHRFDFDQQDPAGFESLYEYVDNATFVNIGARALYQEEWQNKTFRLIAGSELRGDEAEWNANTTNLYANASYTWQVNPTTKYGVGLYFNKGAGITNVLPTIAIEKYLSNTWTLDLNIPKSIQARKQLNPKNFLIIGTQAMGWRYHVTNQFNEEYPDDLMLRRLDVRATVAWERELYDWLWMSVEAGYNKNLRYYLAEIGERRRNALSDLEQQDAKVINFSIFLVPPKKFYK